MLLRSFLCAIFLFLANGFEIPFVNKESLTLLGLAAFSALHGYLTSNCFSLAPALVFDEEKEMASKLMTFSLFLGTICGSLLALLFYSVL